MSVHLSPGLTPLVAANEPSLKIHCPQHCLLAVEKLRKSDPSQFTGAEERHMIRQLDTQVEESKFSSESIVDSYWQMGLGVQMSC